MLVDLDRKYLESLIRGKSPNYGVFENELVKKAGHSYNDHQYGRTSWNSLKKLNEKELYDLYIICKNSYN